MPAKSEVQQQAAGAALAASRGKIPSSELYGSSKEMYNSMSGKELRKFAKTKHKGLPHKKSLVGMNTQGTTNSTGYPHPKACMGVESEAQEIISKLLEDDVEGDDEQAEVSTAQNILAAVDRLQASLTNASDEQQRDLTSIRAAANSLIRSHGSGFGDHVSGMFNDIFKHMDPAVARQKLGQ